MTGEPIRVAVDDVQSPRLTSIILAATVAASYVRGSREARELRAIGSRK